MNDHNSYVYTCMPTYCISGNISVCFIVANLAQGVSCYFMQHAKAESFPMVYSSKSKNNSNR